MDYKKLSEAYDYLAPDGYSRRRELINLQLRGGGNFDFLPFVYTNTNLTKSSISYRVSDHYPLWVEFAL